jgi:hypothetical protein
MPFYRSAQSFEVIRVPPSSLSSLHPCWASSLEEEITSFDRRLNPHRSHQALPQFRHVLQTPSMFFVREPAKHFVRHPALIRHSCRPKRVVSFTSSFLDSFMVQFFLDKSQEVQRQRLLKHRLHQELKSRIAKSFGGKPKDGVQELLQEGYTQHYSTFDSEHGWKLSKDDDRKQVEDQKSCLIQNVVISTPQRTTPQVQFEHVSVEDVDEDDESQFSDIVLVDRPQTQSTAVKLNVDAFEAVNRPAKQVKQELRTLWNRELELLAILGYEDQNSLLPLLEHHVGRPGNPDRSGLKKIIQELLASSSTA